MKAQSNYSRSQAEAEGTRKTRLRHFGKETPARHRELRRGGRGGFLHQTWLQSVQHDSLSAHESSISRFS